MRLLGLLLGLAVLAIAFPFVLLFDACRKVRELLPRRETPRGGIPLRCGYDYRPEVLEGKTVTRSSWHKPGAA